MSYISANDKIYSSWRKMHIRCYDETYHSYHRYGGRGITVCERWLVYTAFKEDMASTWQEGYTIERLNNDKGYEPSNCIWRSKSSNTKPWKADPVTLLAEYEAGATQEQLARKYNSSQPEVSRWLKRARRVTQL